MVIDAHLLIKKTAERIKNGIKPQDLIDDPQKILSGTMKKIVLNKKGKDIQLFEEQIKYLEKKGFKLNEDVEWKNYYNGWIKYVILKRRDEPILVKVIESKETEIFDNFIIFDVPIEEWSWTIKYVKGTNISEYIEMLI